MPKKYDAVVYIGRFQPFHNAHLSMLIEATKLSDKVIIIVGSANQPRIVKNPFTTYERIGMIQNAISANALDLHTKFYFETVEDTVYNNTAWCVNVQSLVAKHTLNTDNIAIIGHKKDNSSEYLEMFPQWGFVDQPLMQPLHATQIRDSFFGDTPNLNWFNGVVPSTTLDFMKSFMNTPEYNSLVSEKLFLVKCKLPYAGLKYPPIFSTADLCVFQNGHVLMGERTAAPGAGLLAFPGGYVDAANDKSCLDAAIREFYEETRAKVPEKVLRGNIVAEKVFDAIERSERGRIITHAFKVDLPAGDFYKVRGSSEIKSARWIPIHEVKRVDCFEDHFDILQFFLGSNNI